MVTITKYLWDDDADTVVMEKDASDTTQVVYQSDAVQYGRLFSMRRGATTYNYRYDAVGNTRTLSDEAGKSTDTYRYDAWGNQLGNTGTTANTYRYGGQHGYQYVGGTSQYNVRERTYTPVQSRWASRDRLGHVDGSNRYVYVENSPPNSSDPSGLLTMSIRGTAHALCGFGLVLLRYTLDKKELDQRSARLWVQHICIRRHIQYCCKNSANNKCDRIACTVTETCCLWELYPFSPKEKKNEWNVDDINGHLGRYSNPNHCPSSKGSVSFKAEVRVYGYSAVGGLAGLNNLSTKKPGNQIKCFGGNHNRNVAPWATTDPKKVAFWFDTKKAKPYFSGSQSSTILWNCCRKTPEQYYSHSTGWNSGATSLSITTATVARKEQIPITPVSKQCSNVVTAAQLESK